MSLFIPHMQLLLYKTFLALNAEVSIIEAGARTPDIWTGDTTGGTTIDNALPIFNSLSVLFINCQS